MLNRFFLDIIILFDNGNAACSKYSVMTQTLPNKTWGFLFCFVFYITILNILFIHFPGFEENVGVTFQAFFSLQLPYMQTKVTYMQTKIEILPLPSASRRCKENNLKFNNTAMGSGQIRRVLLLGICGNGLDKTWEKIHLRAVLYLQIN